MTLVGLKIKKRREELNMTQEELAKKLGYKSKSTINKIEMGINDITQSKIISFADALNTSPAYLMGWEEEERIANDMFATSVSPDMQLLVEAATELDERQIKRLLQYAKFLKFEKGDA